VRLRQHTEGSEATTSAASPLVLVICHTCLLNNIDRSETEFSRLDTSSGAVMDRANRNFSTGTAAGAPQGSGYPFDRLSGTLHQQSGGSNISHRPVKPTSQGQLMETVHNMIEQLRQMKSARQLWDVSFLCCGAVVLRLGQQQHPHDTA
jgi:hypothetical protein